MKFLRTIFFLIVAVSVTLSTFAFSTDSTGSDIFEIEKQTIVQRIGFEKLRISTDYTGADKRLYYLVDSIVQYVSEQDMPRDRRNVYLSRLLVFLQNINRYYSDGYLKSGNYLAMLSYYPAMIEWNEKDELARNIRRYSSFSIKAIRLVPSDTIAEDFLTDYLYDRPDDVFRYAEEFDDRKFGLRLLEKAVRLAPESAKRYYNTNNPVNSILRKSQDLYVKKSYEIFSRFGAKSRAYLLLDAIVNSNMPIESADSLGNQPDQMFWLLVNLSMKYEANVTYSIYRYLDIYCIDAVRKLNDGATNPGTQQQMLNRYSAEELFVLMSYGYQQTTMQTLQQMMETMRKKATGIPVSSVMINSMDKEKLKALVIFCDKNMLLDELLSMVDDEKKDYLLALSSLQEKENPFPPFKNFMPDNPATNSEPEDKTLNEIVRVRTPKPMTEDESDDSGIIKPERAAGVAQPGSTTSTVSLVDEAKTTDIVPVPVEVPAPVVTISIDDNTRKILSLKKNILQTIQDIPSFIETNYAEDVLKYAATKEPDELFKKVEDYRNKRYSKEVLELCAVTAPISLKRYLYNPEHPVNYILGYSTNPIVKKILDINPSLGYHSKPLALLDDIMNGRTDVKQAIEISTDATKLFRASVKIISRQQYLGKYSLDRELRDYSLRFIREINDKIASGAPQPYYSVEGFSSAELYFLMLYGRDEVFTSTFTGLFSRFIQKLPENDGGVFLKSISNNRFRDFISLCAGFGMLDNFLQKFSSQERENLLGAYVSRLETEQDNILEIVLIAEAISSINNTQLLFFLQKKIKTEYERVQAEQNAIGISLYGVLSSVISGNARTETKWYKTIAQQFETTPVSQLSVSSLFNQQVCFEQMYFYNDDDGRSSFINFINTYKSQLNWGIEDRSSYVRVYSLQGMRVEIFANKPDFEENGISAINAYFKEKNLTPTIIVHRGHSFHTETTLQKVPSSAKLVFVGSCGGFYKISIALENAPDAHIISTKQVGTKTVNDAIILALNENIRIGKDIVWNEFWNKMRERLGNNQYFIDYIPPNKNLESIFIRAYYKMLGV